MSAYTCVHGDCVVVVLVVVGDSIGVWLHFSDPKFPTWQQEDVVNFYSVCLCEFASETLPFQSFYRK